MAGANSQCRSTRLRPRRPVSVSSRRRWMPSVRRPRLPGRGGSRESRRRGMPSLAKRLPQRRNKSKKKLPSNSKNFKNFGFPSFLHYCVFFRWDGLLGSFCIRHGVYDESGKIQLKRKKKQEQASRHLVTLSAFGVGVFFVFTFFTL